jgi:hypothetical protein
MLMKTWESTALLVRSDYVQIPLGRLTEDGLLTFTGPLIAGLQETVRPHISGALTPILK